MYSVIFVYFYFQYCAAQSHRNKQNSFVLINFLCARNNSYFYVCFTFAYSHTQWPSCEHVHVQAVLFGAQDGRLRDVSVLSPTDTPSSYSDVASPPHWRSHWAWWGCMHVRTYLSTLTVICVHYLAAVDRLMSLLYFIHFFLLCTLEPVFLYVHSHLVCVQ